MSLVKLRNIQLYHEITGEGPPLLLVNGMGYANWSWFKQVPDLSKQFKVIAFENRGSGRSDKPDIPYNIPMMAQDAKDLLDTLEIEKAHVLGVSMGGFIALELALVYPERVGKLVLCCTSCLGMAAVPEEVLSDLKDVEGKRAEEVIRHGFSIAFSKEFQEKHPEEMENLVKTRLGVPQPWNTLLRQLEASMNFDRKKSLHRIEAPTLVATGDADRIMPCSESEFLAQKIPKATLKTFAGGGHLFFIEQAEAFNQAAADFLQAE